MITVIGIFVDPELADEASSYLLANEFKSENVDLHTEREYPNETSKVSGFFNHLFDNETAATHYASLARNGTVVTVHAVSVREAQEAVDVLNNYGAIEVNTTDETFSEKGTRSLVVEQVVDENLRLRG